MFSTDQVYIHYRVNSFDDNYYLLTESTEDCSMQVGRSQVILSIVCRGEITNFPIFGWGPGAKTLRDLKAIAP